MSDNQSIYTAKPVPLNISDFHSHGGWTFSFEDLEEASTITL